MKIVRNFLDNIRHQFVKGGNLEKLYPIYEAVDTFLYSPGEVTASASHVRDGMDLKRMMVTVVVALGPCILVAMFNTGYQANLYIEQMAIAGAAGWRGAFIEMLGTGYDPQSALANFIHGALYFVPVFIVCNVAGGIWEVIFAIIRKHEVNEGFLVTGMLFPLTLPPTIPLWQVAVGISFGVVIGKEIFGGTGRNILNPALTARAFLYFAYPVQMSGNAVWTAVDGFTGATPLGLVAADGMDALISSGMTWGQAFLGNIQGSMGETSTLACLFGAALLIITGVGSWRIMLSVLVGALALSSLLYGIGSDTNPMFEMSPLWHMAVGGFAFGLVFMATDPVSAAMTETGQWFYGFLIGSLAILIRVINPAFPEGMMLAILFGNVFAPIIDQLVLKANIKRRMLRNEQ